MEFSSDFINVFTVALANGFLQSIIVVLSVAGLFQLVDTLTARRPAWSFVRPRPSTRYAIWSLSLALIFGLHVYALVLSSAPISNA